ncbi:MAG: family 1 encapsulin nanocompartment shell protein [bacterium]
MADYLMRDDAPIGKEDWERIDDVVTETARKQLVGRRFISIYGPLGPGVETVPAGSFSGIGAGTIDLMMGEEGESVGLKSRRYVPIPTIYKDFRIFWRDIEISKRLGVPLDLAPAAMASSFCAQREDELIFQGNKEYGYEGLLNAKGRKTVPLSDWDTEGNALRDVVAATEELFHAGCFAPYVVVVSPSLYAKLQRVYRGTGIMEITRIQEVATGGVYQCRALGDNQGVVVSAGSQNLDLAVSQDLITAYLGPQNMSHDFRVFESLVLRIKRPEAICTLEAKK